MEDENLDLRVHPPSRDQAGKQFQGRGRGTHHFQNRGRGGHQLLSRDRGGYQFPSRGQGGYQFQSRGQGGYQFQSRRRGGQQSQRIGQNGQQPRCSYGIHFSNAPPDIRVVDIHRIFKGFGRFEVSMEPGAQHGWVGFDTMEACNEAYSAMKGNYLGLYLRRGPFEAGHTRRHAALMGDDQRCYDAVKPPKGLPHPAMICYDDSGDPLYYVDEHGVEVGPCTYCLRTTSRSCDKCAAFYCSEICLRADWNRHRDECARDVPRLNLGPRNRHGVGDGDVDERMQRLATSNGFGGPEDADRPGSRCSNPETRSPSDQRSYDGDRHAGRSQQERRQGASGRNEEHTDRRSNDGWDDNRRRSSDDRPGSRFPSRYDRRPGDDQRRLNGFPRWNENSEQSGNNDRRVGNGFNDRRRHGDHHPLGGRPNENGFSPRFGNGDRRGGSDRDSTDRRGGSRHDSGYRRGGSDRDSGDRRGGSASHSVENKSNFNGFSDLFEDGDRRGGSDRYSSSRRGSSGRDSGNRRGGSDRHSMKNKSNENGFSGHFGDSDRCVGGDRHPMGGRRDETGFNERRGEDDHPTTGHDRQRSAEHRNENRFPDRRTAGSEDNKAGEHSFGSKINGTELPPAERGVSLNLKNNDLVVIAGIRSFSCVHLAPPISAYSEGFKRMSELLASHCERAPALDRAPTMGQLVACRFEVDEEFYRAVVKRVLPGGVYVVQFVDYGNSEKCKLGDLKAIPDELKQCPRNCVEVSLRGLDSAPLTGEIETFIEKLGLYPIELNVQFDGDISKGVELFMPHGESVNKKVLSLMKEGERKASPAPKLPDVPDPKENVPDPKKNAPVSKENAPLPERNSPASTSRADNQPECQEQVLSSLLSKVELLGPPAAHPVEESLYVQLKNDDSVVIQFSESTENTYISPANIFEAGDFIKVANKVMSHCSSAPVLDREPRGNEVVGCFDSAVYSRAVVSGVLPDGSYKMFYIDFGNEERCEADRLREIPDDLKILPRQAVKVRFRDVEPVPSTGDVKELLQPLIDESVELKLRFDGSVENGIELIKPDGRSVNEELRAVIVKKKGNPEPEPKREPEPRQEPEPKRELEPRQGPEPEIEEDWDLPDCVPLPTGKSFRLLVFGIVKDHHVAACCAGEPKIEHFNEYYGPRIRDYCYARPSGEHRPKVGQMCLAKTKDGWARALTVGVNDDDTRHVFFVDEGNTCEVEPKGIRKIPPEIGAQPFLLTICRVVRGAPDPEEAWETIKSRIERDIEREQFASFENVTAEEVDGISTVSIKL